MITTNVFAEPFYKDYFLVPYIHRDYMENLLHQTTYDFLEIPNFIGCIIKQNKNATFSNGRIKIKHVFNTH